MKVFECLNNPENWTRFANARNATGGMVDPTSPNAVSRCLRGAVLSCYLPEEQKDVFIKLAETIAMKHPETYSRFTPITDTSKAESLIIHFNDMTRSLVHKDVLEIAKLADI